MTQLQPEDLDGGIDNDEEYDTSDAEQGDENEDEDGAPGGDGGGDEGGGHQQDDEDDVVSFGGQTQAAEPETTSMRELREAYKREKKRADDAEARNRPAPVEIGDKPEYDDYIDRPEEYDRDLLDWNERKRKVGEDATRREEAGKRLQERWEQQHAAFEQGWSDLRVGGKDAARTKVEDAFDTTQQAMLVKASRGNAAGFFFALGNAPDRIAELKKLADDPAEFIAEAAIMAKEVQVTKRRPTTTPEREHRGQSGGGGGADQKLARLEAEARSTGDWSKVVAYPGRK